MKISSHQIIAGAIPLQTSTAAAVVFIRRSPLVVTLVAGAATAFVPLCFQCQAAHVPWHRPLVVRTHHAVVLVLSSHRGVDTVPGRGGRVPLLDSRL